MNTYIVYDGRANHHVDDACMLEYIGETSVISAVKKFKQDWLDHDAVLFEYDSVGDELVNGRIVCK